MVAKVGPEQVGGVHGVPGLAERVGERGHARGQALDVVEEEDFSHGTHGRRVPDDRRPDAKTHVMVIPPSTASVWPVM